MRNTFILCVLSGLVVVSSHDIQPMGSWAQKDAFSALKHMVNGSGNFAPYSQDYMNTIMLPNSEDSLFPSLSNVLSAASVTGAGLAAWNIVSAFASTKNSIDFSLQVTNDALKFADKLEQDKDKKYNDELSKTISTLTISVEKFKKEKQKEIEVIMESLKKEEKIVLDALKSHEAVEKLSIEQLFLLVCQEERYVKGNGYFRIKYEAELKKADERRDNVLKSTQGLVKNEINK